MEVPFKRGLPRVLGLQHCAVDPALAAGQDLFLPVREGALAADFAAPEKALRGVHGSDHIVQAHLVGGPGQTETLTIQIKTVQIDPGAYD